MRSNGSLAVLAALMAGYLSCSSATAAEKTLEFKLVVKQYDQKTLEAPNVPGQIVTESRAFGVGIFQDGRIAAKDFIVVSDLNKGVGSMYGYSTYTFDEGSTITARFTADLKPNQPIHGEYKIVSGTGVYAGATGTGTLDGIPHKFKEANVLNIKLNVSTP